MRSLGWSLLALALGSPGVGQARLADLQQFTAAIAAAHPDQATRAAGARWDEAVLAAKSAAAVDDDAFHAALLRAVALLGDGHTMLLPARDAPLLPLGLAAFADGMFVVGAPAAAKAVVGGCVTALGGVPIDTVLARLRPLAGWDNELGATVYAEFLLTVPAVHLALGLLQSTITVRLGGETIELALPRPVAGFRRDRPGADWFTCPRVASTALVDREGERPFWRSYEAADDLLYCRLARMERSDGATSFATFCGHLRAELERRQPQKLVIDLRGNPGGTNDVLPPLLDLVRTSPTNVDGRLFVLIDRRAFSAAMNCATRLERGTAALFVGEPTGARPNHCGDASTTVLGHTGLRLRCSTRRWRDSEPEDERPWIRPDLPAPRTFEDWVAGRDPAMVAVVGCNVEAKAAPEPGPRWRRPSQSEGWPPGGR